MNNKIEKLLQLLLQESRKVYKDAPRISVFKELEPYKDEEDYYISFTSIEKIGVNPQSTFNTPLGIYTYPLKQSWEKYKISEGKKVGKAVPFAGENPYVWLVKKKKGIKFINSAGDYTEADLEADKKKLTEYILKNKERYYKSFFVDYPYYLKEYMVENYFNIWERKAFIDLPVSKLWNITRNLSFRGREGLKDTEMRVRNSIIANWNTLFYKVLGYYGFADKTGVGYIHSNEPIQAVFFTKNAFDVVKFSQNKEREFHSKEEMENKNWFYENSKNIKVSKAKVKAMGTKRIKWESGTWHKGTWKYGIWVDGIWEDGDWYGGNWLNGTWEGGRWFGGTWYNGTWEKGYFDNGTWKNGVWKMGSWNGGTWENGTFSGGTWYNGTWKNGVMKWGRWENGIWEDGTFKDGEWRNGVWKGGNWDSGIWHGGLIYDPEKKGNFKSDWDWTKDGNYVKSSISPKEYWAGKENLKPKIEKIKSR